jgi:hypothetical protein
MVQQKVSEYAAFGHWLVYTHSEGIKPTLQTPSFSSA